MRYPASNLKALVAQRHTQCERYLTLEIPTAWTGNPVATVKVKADHSAETVLTGIAASPGVVTGRAVVVLDPSQAEVDSGDILVAHTTDPAWVPIMFLADALVVDIGGLMSHAAIVARELDIPCVMATTIGTETLHTGDLIKSRRQYGHGQDPRTKIPDFRSERMTAAPTERCSGSSTVRLT